MMKIQTSRKIRIAILILCVALGILAVGIVRDIIFVRIADDPGSEQDEPIELDLVYAYQNPLWNQAVETVIQEFEEQYPQITVNYEVSYEDKVYENILNKKIARHELGDIIQLKTPDACAKAGLLSEMADSVCDKVTTAYTYNGKNYGTAIVESTWGVLYNRDIFQRYGLSEPETYEEFLDICGFLSRRGITPVGVGGSDLWHLEYWVNHFFRTDVLSEDENWLEKCRTGAVSWTDEMPEKMLQHLYSLFHSGYLNEDWLTAGDTGLTYKMSEEEVAMIYTGPWSAEAIRSMNPDQNLGWFFIPADNGLVYAADNFDTYWAVTEECAADEKKYEAALTFLAFFYEKETYKTFCETTYTFPVLQEAVICETGELGEDVSESLKAADVKSTVYIGNRETPEGFEEEMLKIVRAILSDSCSFEEGLQKIQEIWVKCSSQEEMP